MPFQHQGTDGMPWPACCAFLEGKCKFQQQGQNSACGMRHVQGGSRPRQHFENCPHQHWKRGWEPDDASDHCRRCEKSFGLFTRRHHCRECGSLCCSSCWMPCDPIGMICSQCALVLLPKKGPVSSPARATPPPSTSTRSSLQQKPASTGTTPAPTPAASPKQTRQSGSSTNLHSHEPSAFHDRPLPKQVAAPSSTPPPQQQQQQAPSTATPTVNNSSYNNANISVVTHDRFTTANAVAVVAAAEAAKAEQQHQGRPRASSAMTPSVGGGAVQNNNNSFDASQQQPQGRARASTYSPAPATTASSAPFTTHSSSRESPAITPTTTTPVSGAHHNRRGEGKHAGAVVTPVATVAPLFTPPATGGGGAAKGKKEMGIKFQRMRPTLLSLSSVDHHQNQRVMDHEPVAPTSPLAKRGTPWIKDAQMYHRLPAEERPDPIAFRSEHEKDYVKTAGEQLTKMEHTAMTTEEQMEFLDHQYVDPVELITGDFEKLQRLLQRILAIQERFSLSDFRIAHTLHKLGLVNERLEKFDAAIHCYERNLEVLEENRTNPAHRREFVDKTVETLSAMGETYSAMREFAKAREALSKGLKLQDEQKERREAYLEKKKQMDASERNVSSHSKQKKTNSSHGNNNAGADDDNGKNNSNNNNNNIDDVDTHKESEPPTNGDNDHYDADAALQFANEDEAMLQERFKLAIAVPMNMIEACDVGEDSHTSRVINLKRNAMERLIALTAASTDDASRIKLDKVIFDLALTYKKKFSSRKMELLQKSLAVNDELHQGRDSDLRAKTLFHIGVTYIHLGDGETKKRKKAFQKASEMFGRLGDSESAQLVQDWIDSLATQQEGQKQEHEEGEEERQHQHREGKKKKKHSPDRQQHHDDDDDDNNDGVGEHGEAPPNTSFSQQDHPPTKIATKTGGTAIIKAGAASSSSKPEPPLIMPRTRGARRSSSSTQDLLPPNVFDSGKSGGSPSGSFAGGGSSSGGTGSVAAVIASFNASAADHHHHHHHHHHHQHKSPSTSTATTAAATTTTTTNEAADKTKNPPPLPPGFKVTQPARSTTPQQQQQEPTTAAPPTTTTPTPTAKPSVSQQQSASETHHDDEDDDDNSSFTSTQLKYVSTVMFIGTLEREGIPDEKTNAKVEKEFVSAVEKVTPDLKKQRQLLERILPIQEQFFHSKSDPRLRKTLVKIAEVCDKLGHDDRAEFVRERLAGIKEMEETKMI